MNVCTGGVSIALTAIGKLVGDLVVFPQGETTGGGEAGRAYRKVLRGFDWY